MKYTDRFFHFPVKVYDNLSLAKASIEDSKRIEAGELPEKVHVDNAVAIKAIDHKEIKEWMESFTNDALS